MPLPTPKKGCSPEAWLLIFGIVGGFWLWGFPQTNPTPVPWPKNHQWQRFNQIILAQWMKDVAALPKAFHAVNTTFSAIDDAFWAYKTQQRETAFILKDIGTLQGSLGSRALKKHVHALEPALYRLLIRLGEWGKDWPPFWHPTAPAHRFAFYQQAYQAKTVFEHLNEQIELCALKVRENQGHVADFATLLPYIQAESLPITPLQQNLNHLLPILAQAQQPLVPFLSFSPFVF